MKLMSVLVTGAALLAAGSVTAEPWGTAGGPFGYAVSGFGRDAAPAAGAGGTGGAAYAGGGGAGYDPRCECVPIRDYTATFYDTRGPAPVHVRSPGVRVSGPPVFVPGADIHIQGPPVYVDAPPVRVGPSQIYISAPNVRVRPSEVIVETPDVHFTEPRPDPECDRCD